MISRDPSNKNKQDIPLIIDLMKLKTVFNKE
jgi:hypothetical protein